MNRTILAALALLGSLPAGGAISYTRFAHPQGDYVLEYPSDWKRSLGLQLVDLRPPGRAGAKVQVSLERYPLGRNSPQTPSEYVRGLMDKVGILKRLDGRKKVKVSGRKAERLELTETAELKDSYGQKLPGPLREVQLVVPYEGSYYVLRLEGVGEAFHEALPEFERMAENLKLGPQEDKKR